MVLSKVIILVLVTISFILTTVAAFSCEFVSTFGFVGFTIGGHCVKGIPNNGDSAWTAGFAFAMLAFIFALFTFLMTCMPTLGKAKNKQYSCLAGSYLVVFLFQCLSLIALGGNLARHRSLAAGADCAIAAIVFWLISAVLASQESKKEDEDEEGNENPAEEPLIEGEA
mmetsp:Transcript_16640/g.22799  ORF Transcript_16640/g.22799 Transcript_16640/m.22799 type:complete len:169 (-) Transcript_16640:264-770(-)